MKNYRTYIGIDVAKLTLDYCIVKEDPQLEQGQILNTQKSVDKFLKTLKKTGCQMNETLSSSKTPAFIPRCLRWF